MKRRIIESLSVVLMITILLCGCESTPPEPTIINGETDQTTVGNYSVFRTQYVQQYLDFLKNFDETKYEIVDISTSYSYYVKGSDEFYIVTYKTIAE